MDDLIATNQQVNVYRNAIGKRYNCVKNYILNDGITIGFEFVESFCINKTGRNICHALDYQMRINSHGFSISRQLIDEPFSFPSQWIQQMDTKQYAIIKNYIPFIMSHIEKDFYDMQIITFGL